MLGATFVNLGNPYTTGNISALNGECGSFCDSLVFGYLYQQLPDNYCEYITANNGSALLFSSQEARGRAVAYHNTTTGYRVIYTTFNFGAMRDSLSTKSELFDQYIEFLLPTAVEETGKTALVRDLLLTPNPGRDRIACRFAVSRPGQVSVNVYDASGRKIRTLAAADFVTGNYSISWNGRDDDNCPVSNGTYFFRIITDDAVLNRTAVILR